MVLNTSSVENSIEISLPLRPRSQSHNPARTISKASSAKTLSLFNPLPSDTDSQVCQQLVAISDSLQYCETSAPRGEKSRASYSNVNSQNSSQERILLSFPESSVQSTGPEPVLASKNGPPVTDTTEDDLEFLYSIPTRIDGMKNSGKRNKILEKGVGNSCFTYGNFMPEVVKEKVTDVESEVYSTLASTHIRFHIPPTRAEADLLPAAAISQNRKVQEKKTSFKMEANYVQDDASATPKSKECSASLRFIASSIGSDRNGFEQEPQSVSPKTMTQQGLPNLQGGARIAAQSPIHADSQVHFTSLSPQQAQHYEHAAAQQSRLCEQLATPQQQAAPRQFMIVEPGNLQGFGLLPPQGPQASQFVPPMSHPECPESIHPHSSNLGYAAQPSPNLPGISGHLNPQPTFSSSPPATPQKQSMNGPQNGGDLAPIPLGSYTTDDNIQRRPTLYGAPEWQPSSEMAHTVDSTNVAANVPYGGPKYPNVPNTIDPWHNTSAPKTGQPAQSITNGSAVSSYGPSLSAQSIWQQQGVRKFHTFEPVEGTAVSQATPPQSITPTNKPPYSQPIQQLGLQTAGLQMLIDSTLAAPQTTAVTPVAQTIQQNGFQTAELQMPIDSTLATPQTMADAPVAKPSKPSIHLLVDIAQTCEKVFPWEFIASRHGVTMKRVQDIFSAVIQIPLLKNANDARRYGALASQRLKDFKIESKAAAESQQEGDELGGDLPKPTKAKRGRKRKVMEPAEVQDGAEAPVQKYQKVEEK